MLASGRHWCRCGYALYAYRTWSFGFYRWTYLDGHDEVKACPGCGVTLDIHGRAVTCADPAVEHLSVDDIEIVLIGEGVGETP
jgi:hypothetical protein